MKNILYPFIIVASATLFALPSHLSAQLPIELNESTANVNAKAERGFSPEYGFFSTSSQKTQTIEEGNTISFDTIGYHTNGVRPYRDPKTGVQSILVTKSGIYRVATAASQADSTSNPQPKIVVTVDKTQHGPYLEIPYNGILAATETFVKICVPDYHECCSFPRGCLINVLNAGPGSMTLSTLSSCISAYLSITRLDGPSCDCDFRED